MLTDTVVNATAGAAADKRCRNRRCMTVISMTGAQLHEEERHG
jgi:hypothetical protein